MYRPLIRFFFNQIFLKYYFHYSRKTHTVTKRHYVYNKTRTLKYGYKMISKGHSLTLFLPIVCRMVSGLYVTLKWGRCLRISSATSSGVKLIAAML